MANLLHDKLNKRLQARAEAYHSEYQHIEDVQYALKHATPLNNWEIEFLISLVKFPNLSGKQRDKLEDILQKIDNYRRRRI